jgi:hypothetical protein
MAQIQSALGFACSALTGLASRWQATSWASSRPRAGDTAAGHCWAAARPILHRAKFGYTMSCLNDEIIPTTKFSYVSRLLRFQGRAA